MIHFINPCTEPIHIFTTTFSRRDFTAQHAHSLITGHLYSLSLSSKSREPPRHEQLNSSSQTPLTDRRSHLSPPLTPSKRLQAPADENEEKKERIRRPLRGSTCNRFVYCHRFVLFPDRGLEKKFPAENSERLLLPKRNVHKFLCEVFALRGTFCG